MKLILRIIFPFLVVFLIFLCRGWIYRHIVTYQSVADRQNYAVTDEKLITLINTFKEEEEELEIKDIINTSLSLTSEELHFTFSEAQNDPNELIHSKAAHCVGYAAFFAASCNYLILKKGLGETWIAKPQIGQLYVFGINLHNYLPSSFFKDHDFVSIENKDTGEVYAVDPSLYDYTGIDLVTFKK